MEQDDLKLNENYDGPTDDELLDIERHLGDYDD
mgnify:CR=1 FL=1